MGSVLFKTPHSVAVVPTNVEPDSNKYEEDRHTTADDTYNYESEIARTSV